MKSFTDVIAEQIEWSRKTFGPGDRLAGLTKHIEKEVQEVRDSSGKDLSEWVDIMILAVDGAQRAGFTADEIVRGYVNKLAVNYRRDWPDWRTAKKDQPIEHVRHETSPSPFPAPIVIGLVGKAGSGKSSVSRILSSRYGFARRPFAFQLKAMLGALGVPSDILDGDNAAKSKPLPELSGRTFRHAAQTLGTEWGRYCMGKSFWVSRWADTIPAGVSVVADDTRFENEAQVIRDLGGFIIRIKRNGAEAHGEHAGHLSETEQDNIKADFEIDNNGSFESLAEAVDRVMRKIMETRREHAAQREAAE